MRVLLRVIVAAFAIALIAWLAWRWAVTPREPDATGIARSDSATAGYKAARLSFASTTGDGFVSEVREMPDAGELHERVAALIAALARGPEQGGASVLPPGTELLHVYLDDRGTLTLDLSRAFQDRFQGGSSAEYLAAGSLVRTLADNVPDVKRVLFTCGGAPIASLGGHLPLDRPIEVESLP